MTSPAGSGPPVLRGTTWDHPRAWAPLVVLAEQSTDLVVEWEIRSLQAFADQPLEELAEAYDLLVVDHPFVGEAAERGLVVPLDEGADAAVLAAIRAGSVGRSWESYTAGGRPFAFPLDAAGQMATWRPDLLGEQPPQDWRGVIALARDRRDPPRVGVAMMPTDLWCLFLTLIASAGVDIFRDDGVVVERPVGLRAVALLRELAAHVHPLSRSWNPIQLFDTMSSTEEVAYCPAAFGYVPYAITGFRPRLLAFGPVPRLGPAPARPVIGGAGVAVSARRPRIRDAIAYASRLCVPDVQAGSYAAAGGQPAHRAAWQDPTCDARAHGFFSRTLPQLDHGFLRPRLPGFVDYQRRSYGPLAAAVWDGADAGAVLDGLDRGWSELVGRKSAAARGKRESNEHV
jgi:multiple sugar transport system substrate-binding protein